MPSLSLLSPIELKSAVKYPMLAQVNVCNGCCCGHTEKGHPEVPVEWLKKEWKHRGLLKRVHLTISGCLGPCDVSNVILIASVEGTRWFGRLDKREQYEMLAYWAEQSKLADRLLPLPNELGQHRLSVFREDQSVGADAR